VRRATIGMGNTVTVDIDASSFVPSTNGTVFWPFVNGSQQPRVVKSLSVHLNLSVLKTSYNRVYL
jgi:hypothetical protein